MDKQNEISLRDYFEALRAADQRALQIKEEADKIALELARTIQAYKDEKANELREQINNERGLYPTKTDLVAVVEKLEATIKPLADYVSTQQGRSTGFGSAKDYIMTALALVLGLIAIYGFLK